MPKPWQDLTDMFDQGQCIDEMVKKYKGTYLRISTPNSRFLAQYQGWNGDKHIFYDSNNQAISLAVDTEYNVSIWMPRRGLYNTTRKGMHLLLRLPFRQFRRGVSKESAIATPMNLLMLGSQPSNALENQVYDIADRRLQLEVTLDEAIDKAKQFGSWAINRSFGVILNFFDKEEDTYILMYEDIPVARVVGHEIRVSESMFKQELIEDVQAWAPTYTVIA